MDKLTATQQVNFEIIKSYCESAKSFVQLSSAGLLVPMAIKTA